MKLVSANRTSASSENMRVLGSYWPTGKSPLSRDLGCNIATKYVSSCGYHLRQWDWRDGASSVNLCLHSFIPSHICRTTISKKKETFLLRNQRPIFLKGSLRPCMGLPIWTSLPSVTEPTKTFRLSVRFPAHSFDYHDLVDYSVWFRRLYLWAFTWPHSK